MRERVGGEIVVKFISLVGASNFLLVGVGSWRTYTPRASDRDDLQGGEMLLVGLLVGQIWYCCGGGALVCLFKSFFFQESNLLHRVRRSWHDGGSVRIFRDSIINKWLRCRRECFNFGKDHTRPIAMPFGLGSGDVLLLGSSERTWKWFYDWGCSQHGIFSRLNFWMFCFISQTKPTKRNFIFLSTPFLRFRCTFTCNVKLTQILLYYLSAYKNM